MAPKSPLETKKVCHCNVTQNCLSFISAEKKFMIQLKSFDRKRAQSKLFHQKLLFTGLNP